MAVISSLLAALFEVFHTILGLFVWILIISAVLSWLTAFEVVNPYNRFVRTVGDICNRLTEPFLRPIRKWVPVMGGLDISPVILILAIMFLQSFLRHLLVSL